MNRPVVLVAEDSESDRTVALRGLERGGFAGRVAVARDGEEALDYLGRAAEAAQLPKVVFLDLRMPRMDGLEVLHEIRSDERMAHVPVVMVSSSSRADDIEKSYDSGANGYLVKRFDGSSPGGFLAEAARYWVELNEVVQ